MTMAFPATLPGFHDLVGTGSGLPKAVGGQFTANLNSIVYQGPAMTLYAWFAVYQTDSDFQKLESQIIPITVPLSNTPTSINNPIGQASATLQPSGGRNVVPGLATRGVVIIGTAQSLLDNTWLARMVINNAYVISAGVTFTPPSSLVATPHLLNQQSVVDLAWNRASGGALQQEFIDIVIAADQASAQVAFGKTPGVDYVSFSTSQLTLNSLGNNRYSANNIPVTPSALHWWRVTSVVQGNPNWLESPVISFQSVAQPVSQSSVSDIQAFFQ